MRNAGILAALVAAAAVWMVVAADQQVAGHMDKLAEGLFELFTEDKQFPLVLSAAIWAVAFVLLVAYPLLVVAPQSVSLRRLRALSNGVRTNVHLQGGFTRSRSDWRLTA